MKKLTLCFAVLLMCIGTMAQSKTIAEFEKDKGFGKKLFLYESYIRMLNLNENPDYYKLVKDVEYIKVVRAESEVDVAKKEYRNLQSSIQKEGYEEVFMAEDKEGMASIYLYEEEGEKTQWIVFMQKEEMTVALVLHGSLNLEYMKGLSSLNHEMLENYINDKGFDTDWD